MVSGVTMTDPPLLIASPSLYPPPSAPSPTPSPSPCLLPLLWESGTLGLQLYSLRTRVISEALRFHRWPMWTLVVQRGVMVGCPRQLKANLEPRGGAYVRIAVVGAQGRGEGKEGRGGGQGKRGKQRVLTSHNASLTSSRRVLTCCYSET